MLDTLAVIIIWSGNKFSFDKDTHLANSRTKEKSAQNEAEVVNRMKEYQIIFI